jgi:5-methylcytosine-specific restriction endonuclease McrA
MSQEEERKLRNREKIRRYRERHPDRVKLSRIKYRQKPGTRLKEQIYRTSSRGRESARQRSAKYGKSSKGQAYHRQWYAENRERLLNLSKEYRNRPEIKLKIRRRMLIQKYGEMAFAVLKRDNDTCQKCGTRQHIHIHHIDGDKTNSTIENLIVLCNSCHIKLHNHVPKNLKRLIFEEWIKDGKNNPENHSYPRNS